MATKELRRKGRFDYIIYDKDDMPIFIGTTGECMKFLNISKEAFYACVSRGKQGIVKHRITAYKIDDEVI